MASALQALTVELKADLSNLQRGLSVAQGSVSRFTSQTKSVLASLGTGAGLAGLAAAAAGSFVAMAKSAAEAADAVGDAAAATGLSTRTFQEFQQAVAFSDIGADEFQSSMQKLADVTGNALAGNKQAASTFDQLGVSLRDSAGHVKTQDQVLAELTTALGTYGTSADRAALATDLFGRGVGPKFAAFASQGSAAIDDLISKTSVFSDEQIRLASEVNDKWELLATTVGIKFKAAMLEALKATNLFVAGFSLGEVNNEIAKVQLRLERLKAQAGSPSSESATADRELAIRESEAQLAKLEDQQRALLSQQRAASPEFRDAQALQSQLARLRSEAIEENAKLDEKREKDAIESERRIAEQRQAGLDKEAEARIDQLQREGDARREFERTEAEAAIRRREGENALQERLYSDRIRSQREAQRELLADVKTFSDSAAQDIAGLFERGELSARSFGDVVKRMLIEIATQQLITKPLSGVIGGAISGGISGFKAGGGFGNLFGGLRIPGFAGGGNPPVGRVSLVGERGPELFVPRSAGTIVPLGQASKLRIVLDVERSMTVKAEPESSPDGDALRVVVRRSVEDELSRRGAFANSINAATGGRRPPRTGRN